MINSQFKRFFILLSISQVSSLSAGIWDYFHFNFNLFHVSTPVGAVSVNWNSREPGKPRVMASSIFTMPLCAIGSVAASGAFGYAYHRYQRNQFERHEKFSMAVKNAKLLRAMREGSMSEARYWLHAGASVNARAYPLEESAPRVRACPTHEHGRCVRACEALRRSSSTGISVLEYCVDHVDESMARYCLKNGADSQSKQEALSTVLHRKDVAFDDAKNAPLWGWPSRQRAHQYARIAAAIQKHIPAAAPKHDD